MSLFFQEIDDSPYLQYDEVKTNKEIKLVDLFAGIGGFHYGISAAASKLNYRVKPILVSELEKTNQETYFKNFNFEPVGDINKINLSDYIDLQADIVTAGFPCQPFSNSGKKLGLTDPRGQFYFKIEEIIKHFKSKAFILENVPGIKTNGGGRYPSKLSLTPRKIGATMKYLEDNLVLLRDYNVKWVELDTSDFGSPQVRRRVYIIGIHKDYGNKLNLEFNSYKRKVFADIAEKVFLSDLELNDNHKENVRSFMQQPPKFTKGMRRVGQAYLCKGGNVGQTYHAYGHVPTLTVVWAKFYPIYFPHHLENRPSLEQSDFKPNKFYGKGFIRKASVREVLRLQGFPDKFQPHSNRNISYQQAGNAVNAKVIREIGENILRYIV